MELTKAKDLGEAFRLLTPDPLESPAELAAYYAITENKSFAQLRIALLNSDPLQPTKWLVTGHRGNGKSTEFHKLMNDVQKDCFVIYADAVKELDLNDIEAVDLLVLIGARIYAEAHNAKIPIPEDLIERIFERLERFEGAPEPDKLEGESTVGAKLNLVLAEFTVQLSKAFGARKELRERLNSNYSELLQQFNELIQYVARAVEPRSLLVIVDSMDRLNPGRALDVFHYSTALQAIECKAIYTPPLAIFYCQDFAQIRIGFDENTIVMPNIKTTTKSGKSHTGGRTVLRHMILNRLEEQLIAQDALTHLIKLSGGLPRQLFTLARDACTFAMLDDNKQILLRHVKQAEIQSRNNLGNILTPEDYAELCVIYKGEKQVMNTPQRDMLFHKLSLFQYTNANSWVDVNPILQPLLRERCDET